MRGETSLELQPDVPVSLLASLNLGEGAAIHLLKPQAVVPPFAELLAGGVQSSNGTRSPYDPACEPSRRSDQVANATQSMCVGVPLSDQAGGDLAAHESHMSIVPAGLIALLVERYRLRRDLMSARMRLELQIKAICRRSCSGDKDEAAKVWSALKSPKKSHPLAAAVRATHEALLVAFDQLLVAEKSATKQIEKMAKELPVWSRWAEGVRGLGALSVAQLVGEAGRDLADYGTPAKLWKRFGLAVFDGVAQGYVRDAHGKRVAAKRDEAIAHGYSRTRHSVAVMVGDGQIKSRGLYRQLYDDRKAFEIAKAPEERPAVHDRRAKRYITKRLIRDLWIAWRGGIPSAPTMNAGWITSEAHHVAL